MIVFLIFASIVVSICVIAMLIAGVIVWACRVIDPCNHCYERIDDCNDKRMILVCRRCGKIRKLRK
jgi:uncharacterized membrane protein YqhA